jgi:hypothetical protein
LKRLVPSRATMVLSSPGSHAITGRRNDKKVNKSIYMLKK